MTALLYRLGGWCARHHRAVLLGWVVAVAALAVFAGRLGSETNDNVSLPGTGSQRAADVLDADFSSNASNGTVPIVLRAPAGARLTDGAPRDAVERIAARYADDRAVRSVVSPLAAGGAAQLSGDARIGYLSLALRASPTELTVGEAERVFDLARRPAHAAGLDVAAGGYLGSDLSQPASADSEGIGLLAAIVVLLFTFGTVVAMGLPILTAVLGLGAGVSLLTIATHVVQVPSTALPLATMIGLGVGIDYALFIVTRHREQLAAGMAPHESAARAVATAGGAVVFAGGTVVIALCSLVLTGIPIVAQLGLSSAVAVLVAVLAATTLLPAALAALGTRIDALRLPRLHHAASRGPRQDGAWARWARGVARRPWPALLAALALLLALAWPATTLDLGQPDVGQLPRETTARQAYDLLAEGFGPGANGPLLVAVRLDGDDAAASAALERLHGALERAPGVAAVSPPAPAPRGGAALMTVMPRTAPSAPATARLVRRLRAETIPAALGDAGAVAYVGGSTAGFVDLADEIGERLPLVIGLVLALSFLLLTLAFRSLVVPLKAVAMNLLSIGAAFGVVAFVFSHGWTAGLIGVDGAAPIVSFVPLMMFAILFGLSMDYEVFLMTHVRERWQATGDAHRAVVEGLAGTARVITSAALIMVAVFLAFVLDPSPTIKQFGLGMAVAVAIDATVVRCLLAPAVLALLGRRAWWLPAWLERRAPRISIEGEAYFAERDAAAAAQASAPVASGPAPAETPAAR